jgi:hypothetical protein
MGLIRVLYSIADLECNMNGTTAATCSGYSSYRSGYTNGMHTGPTEVTWTSTLAGSNIHWGALTLAEKPAETDDSLDVTATNIAAPKVPSPDLSYSTPTQGSSGRTLLPDGRWTRAISLLSILAGSLTM